MMAPMIKQAPTIDINVTRTITVVLALEFELDPSLLLPEEAVLLADAVPVATTRVSLTALVEPDVYAVVELKEAVDV